MMNLNLNHTDRRAASLLTLLTTVMQEFADGERGVERQEHPHGRTTYRLIKGPNVG